MKKVIGTTVVQVGDIDMEKLMAAYDAYPYGDDGQWQDGAWIAELVAKSMNELDEKHLDETEEHPVVVPRSELPRYAERLEGEEEEDSPSVGSPTDSTFTTWFKGQKFTHVKTGANREEARDNLAKAIGLDPEAFKAYCDAHAGYEEADE